MKKVIIFLLVNLHLLAFAQKTCAVKNKSFQAGEVFNYKVYYNWGAIWVSAGEASFSTQLTEINAHPLYHFIGEGSTYPKYDFLYKVRDKYESYADTATLKPYRFTREAREGGSYTFDDYVFSQQKNKVYTAERRNKKPIKYDSINTIACTKDLMTAIFYARCLDFSMHKPNDTIPITFVLDGKVYLSYIRYMGKEIIHNEALGNVRCIKFRPKLIEGTLFKEGEEMIVWVTDDDNKMPVYVETPILVGTIKVKLYRYSGLRNKLDCIVRKR
ncbi:MAG: DUF3108 domain-containing protein [Bacteroidia bacterium]